MALPPQTPTNNPAALTIDQAFQQAMAHHQAGQLLDAERLYRAILETQANHPDANHNLGVLAVQMNQAAAALPYFKTALEANPNQGQYWLSYIDGLIQTGRHDVARQISEEGKQRGLHGTAFDALVTRLDANHPSPQSVDALVSLFADGRYRDAEVLARTMTEQIPLNEVGWKALGVALLQTGRIMEALEPMHKAAALSPNDAEAHSNLGNTFYALGRFDEAEASYRRALQIESDYAEAHYNLGNTLRDLGRLEDAEASYRRALQIRQAYAEAHLNLGDILNTLGRLDEAEASYRRAIQIKPAYAAAYSNLGLTLNTLGRLDEAEASYHRAIQINPNDAKAHSNLGVTLNTLGRNDEAEASYRRALQIEPAYAEAHYNLGVLFYEQGKYEQAAELLRTSNFKNSQNYVLKCLYFLNDKLPFYKQLDSLIGQGEINPTIGSLSCRAEIKYGIVKSNPFCSDPLKYLLKTDLSKDYDFLSKFVKPTSIILNESTLHNRSQKLLTNGRQTSGNLFALENIWVDEIKRIIGLEIEKYKTYFKDSDEGLIKNWPSAYNLHGWIISMKSGGELLPHMHENGWLSGSIYINVPSKLNTNDGNLVVCIEDDKYLTAQYKNKKNIINVTTGALCLFPASLLHYTIPFESDEERIVLAFDVVPK